MLNAYDFANHIYCAQYIHITALYVIKNECRIRNIIKVYSSHEQVCFCKISLLFDVCKNR